MTEQMTPTADLVKEVESIEWFHTIELRDGYSTPGGSRTDFAAKNAHLPATYEGKTVLDVGAWDGYYSLDAYRKGARRVLATDSFAWDKWGRRGFDLVMRECQVPEGGIDTQHIDVMDLSPDQVGTFDVVLFLGVLYHLADPIGALRAVSSVCDDFLLLETETCLSWLPYPAARLWPGAELNGDDTNWWSINERALTGILRSLGFTRIERKYRTAWYRRVGRAVKARRFSALRSARIVLHVYR